ncbi:MAG: AMP-dependent synthetase/ligase [Micrococcales bacterium]|nr:AMP-dependent synthetase/ligase [Micrococcales bacterium]MCL2666860.1 AMP-dependent synthetase/ligase [Micrococcales bacterium]
MRRDPVHTPAPIPDDPTRCGPQLLADLLAENPDRVCIEHKDTEGVWHEMTTGEFDRRVRAVAKGLVASGINVGDRVAILCPTRWEWTLLDFAIWAAGGVGVPVYETSSAEQVRWICADAGARLVVVETPAHAARVDEVRDDLPGLLEVLTIDEGAVATLEARGAQVDDAEIAGRSALTQSDTLATVIYTSGTTGRPKGVELTHGNLVTHAYNGARSAMRVLLEVEPQARTILFLPLAHVFARYIQIVSFVGRAVLTHCPDTHHLLEDLAAVRPTFILAVPRVFEKVYNSADQKAGHGMSRRIFRWSAKVAITYSRALDTKRGPNARLRAARQIADRLVYRKVRAAFGGQLEYAISGGAPLGERLGHYFRGIGVTIMEGYGLTETMAPTSVNLPGLTKVGSVGPAFPGCWVRVDEHGEVWAKGPHIFRGYRNEVEATKKVLVDGWFATGDLGTLDDDGYLSITGRKKEIIVTAGGKNVAPAVLEDRLRGHPLVSQVVVVGDKRPFIGALVTLDAEMLPGWLATHDLPPMDMTVASRHPRVLAALDAAVERTNEVVSRAESIRKIKVLDTDFTEANGYLTPSTKVKRGLVLRDFAAQVDELYIDTRPEHDRDTH